MLDPQTAEGVVMELHKRAFLGRLAQHGFAPQTEKEAAALLDLGVELFAQDPNLPSNNPGGYGDGPFAQAKQAFHAVSAVQSDLLTPGFGKQAASMDLPGLPDEMVEAAYDLAADLANDPLVYQAAVAKRASVEAEWAAAGGAK